MLNAKVTISFKRLDAEGVRARLDISLDIKIEKVFMDPDLERLARFWAGGSVNIKIRAIFCYEWLREINIKLGRKMMVFAGQRCILGQYTEIKPKSNKAVLMIFPRVLLAKTLRVPYHACANRMFGLP